MVNAVNNLGSGKELRGCNIRIYPDVETETGILIPPTPTSQFSNLEPATQGGKNIQF